jgi:small subunit ribosomal protein S20
MSLILKDRVDFPAVLFYHTPASKETLMLKHASAVRQQRRSVRRNKINKKNTSALRTEVRKVRSLIEEKDQEAARKALPEAYAVIDRSVKKGAIHANAGARYKSRLGRQVEAVKPAAK